MKKIFLLVTLIALFGTVQFQVASANEPAGGWRGEYYDNPDLADEPVRIKTDWRIDFDWENQRAIDEVSRNNFSIRWTGSIQMQRAGTYCFSAKADDGIRIYVDDNLILDAWSEQWGQNNVVGVDLTQGNHDVTIEYRETVGRAFITVDHFELSRISAAPADGNGWQGVYYDNDSFQGCPAQVRVDESVNFDWGNFRPIPNVSRNEVSIRWFGSINLAETTTYCFSTTADDNVRVWVDNWLLIDGFTDYRQTQLTGGVRLAQGEHQIRIDYIDRAGSSYINFDVASLGEILQTAQNAPSWQGWQGLYYASENPEGCPTVVRQDGAVDFDWGGRRPMPEIPTNKWSARWYGTVNAHETAKYCVSIQADDRARVWINDFLVIDAWNNMGGLRASVGEIQLSPGEHRVRIDYADNLRDASIKFDFYSAKSIFHEADNNNGWVGLYFNDRELGDCAAIKRTDSAINFNWGESAPMEGIRPNGFTVRWVDTFWSASEQNYRFMVRANEGARVFVDGIELIDAWTRTTDETIGADFLVSPGRHTIVVEYRDNRSNANIWFDYWPAAPLQ